MLRRRTAGLPPSTRLERSDAAGRTTKPASRPPVRDFGFDLGRAACFGSSSRDRSRPGRSGRSESRRRTCSGERCRRAARSASARFIGALDGIPNVTVEFAEPSARGACRSSGAAAHSRRQPLRHPGARRADISAAARSSSASVATARRDGHGDGARLCVAGAWRSGSPTTTGMSAADRALLADLAREHRKFYSSQTQRSSSHVGSRAGLPGRLPRPGKARKQPRCVAAGRGGRISRRAPRRSAALDTPRRDARRADSQVPTELLQAFADARASLDRLAGLL